MAAEIRSWRIWDREPEAKLGLPQRHQLGRDEADV